MPVRQEKIENMPERFAWLELWEGKNFSDYTLSPLDRTTQFSVGI